MPTCFLAETRFVNTNFTHSMGEPAPCQVGGKQDLLQLQVHMGLSVTDTQNATNQRAMIAYQKSATTLANSTRNCTGT